MTFLVVPRYASIVLVTVLPEIIMVANVHHGDDIQYRVGIISLWRVPSVKICRKNIVFEIYFGKKQLFQANMCICRDISHWNWHELGFVVTRVTQLGSHDGFLADTSNPSPSYDTCHIHVFLKVPGVVWMPMSVVSSGTLKIYSVQDASIQGNYGSAW